MRREKPPRNRPARVVGAMGALLLAFAAALVPEAATQRVSFRTDDGVAIAGTWYEPANRPAPAVVLVHMLQKSRRDWDAVATRLAGEGIGALAFDLRGHGESQGSAQDFAAMVQDVRAARRFVSSRSDVVLLSPTMDYRGLRIDPALRKYGARPALFVASDDDGYSMRSVRDLQKAGPGTRETAVLNRAGHGTAMFTGDPDLARRVVEWLRRTLL
jgi:pimeloyl-ACP methyl ester carboxylesterase